MHKIQSALKDTDSLNDDELIEKVLSSWSFVCAENKAQQSLVTQKQYQSWESFRVQSDNSLRKALDDYEGRLTPAGKAAFTDIAHSIRSANHETESKLLKEYLAANQNTLDTISKKKKWLGMLNRK